MPVRVFGFCFALYLRVVFFFFMGGFVVAYKDRFLKKGSCTKDHCCVLGPPSTRGVSCLYRLQTQYIMPAPFLFIFNTTLSVFREK